MKMKKKQPLKTDFMEGFAQWLESEEGLQSMDVDSCPNLPLIPFQSCH